MRTIIAGSRNIWNYIEVEQIINECPWEISTILSGNNPSGVDALGERYAHEYSIPLELYPADWARYRLGAGKMRNKLMATKAEALLAIWDGFSPGTKNMINVARASGLKVHIKIC